MNILNKKLLYMRHITTSYLAISMGFCNYGCHTQCWCHGLGNWLCMWLKNRQSGTKLVKIYVDIPWEWPQRAHRCVLFYPAWVRLRLGEEYWANICIAWWYVLKVDRKSSLIARFMGPTWGPSGADRTQVGPRLAPWISLSGFVNIAHC